MVTSWMLGRARVARGERPGWWAAWGLVAFDLAAILGVLALVWGPLIGALEAAGRGPVGTILIIFAVFFVPLQAVMIWSSLWAAKSRWEEKPGKEEDA